uniref:Head-tail connector protein n=1 Tax=Siphoviridae sp. ct4F219 TaxID=2825329 RepID=A0A8S5PXV4_9CAUD|nr:MAG TPA: head-tail connector protein [Siphoviridae sp. ct4F219]
MTAFSDRQASILSYCRIDDPTPEDLSLLEGFHADAVSYMRNAGVAEPETGSARLPQYNTCILALVLDAWDNRGVQTADKAFADNPAFRRRINQLKRTEPVRSESDTEG